MAEPGNGSEDPPALLAWTVAAFNAALLVLVAVGLLYASGSLGDGLAALETALGLAAYLYLWVVTWWTNRRWLGEFGADALAGGAEPVDVLVGALKWGGVAGAMLFVPILVLFAVLVGAGGLQALPFLLVGAVIGVAVATGVGVFVGGVLGLLDLLLLRASRVWLASGDVAHDEPDPGTDIP